MRKTKQDQEIIDWMKETDSIIEISKLVEDIGELTESLKGQTLVHTELVDEVQGACSAVIMIFKQNQKNNVKYKIIIIDGYHDGYSHWEYNPLRVYCMERILH